MSEQSDDQKNALVPRCPIAPDDVRNASGAAKVIGGLLALMAMIAGVYAMVQPMNQTISFMERRLDDIQTSLAHHLETCSAKHSESAQDRSALREKFLASTSQIKLLKEVNERRIKHLEDEIDKESAAYREILKQIMAAEAKIKALEFMLELSDKVED